MKRLIAAACIATLPLSAFAFDDGDRQGVESRVAAFEQDFGAGNFSGVIEVMPPKLLDYMARQMGMKAGDLAGQVGQQMQALMSDVKIENFSMNTNRMKTGTTSAGTDYAFIPTVTTVSAPGQGRKTARSQTLALQDNGQWYLVRIEQAQQFELVKAVYPDFASVKLP